MCEMIWALITIGILIGWKVPIYLDQFFFFSNKICAFVESTPTMTHKTLNEASSFGREYQAGNVYTSSPVARSTSVYLLFLFSLVLSGPSLMKC